MLKPFYLSDVMALLDGSLIQGADCEISGVSTDTRTIQPGDLYIPLKGERFNGHHFIAQAQAAGAVAALVDEDIDSADYPDLPLVNVPECLLALGQIAQYQRQQFTGPVVAVTGSAGKTSVKQLMANVLSQQFNTWMTQGNLNNHIGAPLTLLALQPQHQAAMIELGASGLKEIGYTAQFVLPQVGIITNASAAHLDGFGSLEGIVKTKGELIDFIQPGGCAILNRDDVYFSDWHQRAQQRGLNILTFGFATEADVRADNVRTGLNGSEFNLCLQGESYTVRLPLLGEHNVRNALAVVAAAVALAMPMEKIIAGLESAEAFSGRLRWCDGTQQQRILDDSYNASPASVFAAVDVLANAEHSWLVLGDMAELGDDAENIHADVGAYAQQAGIKNLIATGHYNKKTVARFNSSQDEINQDDTQANGIWFNSRDELITYLQQQTSASDVLLIKGSRSAGMDQVVKALCIGEEEN